MREEVARRVKVAIDQPAEHFVTKEKVCTVALTEAQAAWLYKCLAGSAGPAAKEQAK